MIAQVFIALFGVTAIFLSQSPNPQMQRWACVLGLAGQPFWCWAAIDARQWGVLILCGFYTVAWARGVKTHWFEKRAPCYST